MEVNCKKIKPFLKWAGGKRWFVSSHGDLFNIEFGRYIEPFVGSGSIFFYVNPENAILSDKNKKLIEVYRTIKSNWKRVVEELKTHNDNHSKNYYYHVRSLEYDDEYSRSAQFIYLNRTCWNGLYRVNLRGEFNVPIGTKNKVFLESDDFEGVSKRLSNTELMHGDFGEIIDTAKKGDLLFADPPYTVNHNKNGFLKYNESIFSWDDQVRLSECVKKAKLRGVRIILTNADHVSIRHLYEDDFEIRSVPRASVLSGLSQFRGKVTELLVLGNL